MLSCLTRLISILNSLRGLLAAGNKEGEPLVSKFYGETAPKQMCSLPTKANALAHARQLRLTLESRLAVQG